MAEIEFLASSASLNLPLPNEKDVSWAISRKRKGYIEELHVPSGGIIRLTDDEQWSASTDDQRRVHFHRSRVFVNSVKMSSNASIEDEIGIGDQVIVDILANQVDLTRAYVCGTEAYWVALSVKVKSADRGQVISNRLRAEVSSSSLFKKTRTSSYHDIFDLMNFDANWGFCFDFLSGH